MNRKETPGLSLRRKLRNASLGRDVIFGKKVKKLIINKIDCGEKEIRKHKNGFPLASLKVLKPFPHNKNSINMVGCEEVKNEALCTSVIRTVRVVISSKKTSNKLDVRSSRQPFDSSFSLTKSSKEKKLTETKSTQRSGLLTLKTKPKRTNQLVIIDNNNLTLSKVGKKKQVSNSIKYSWMHIYDINFQADKEEIEYIFYKGTDEGFITIKNVMSSEKYNFETVTVKTRSTWEREEILTASWTAIKEQSKMLRNLSENMLRSVKPSIRQSAEEYIRLSLDLASVSAGFEGQSVVDCIDVLIEFLYGKFENIENEEILFWKDRKEEIEDRLKEEVEQGNVVHGVVI